MWIGAHDRHDEMDWYWVNGVRARNGGSYENWDRGQPSCFLPNFLCHEDCAVLRLDEGYKWHDYLCSSDLYQYGLACEYNMIPVPPTTPAPTTKATSTTAAATTTTTRTTTAATTRTTTATTKTAISSDATTVPIVVVKTNDGEHSALHSDDFTVDNSSLISDQGQGGEIGRHVMSSESGGMSTGSLVGIVVSFIIVFLAGLTVGILFCRRRRAKFTEVYSVGFNNILYSPAPQSDTRVKDTNLAVALSQQEEDSMVDHRYAGIDDLAAEGCAVYCDMGGAKSVDLPTCKEIDKEADLGQEAEANHLYDHIEGEESAGAPPPVPSRHGNLTAFPPEFLQKDTDVLQAYSHNLYGYSK
ncbi:uncharacterized protein LOC127831839 isoform X2 [Dreissena polymorpha]|nr:uncharacterized protein LOC127831839 isoform X2 [Dreissena polymorpha]